MQWRAIRQGERRGDVHWVEQAPIWIVGLVMAAGLCLAHELGFQAGRRLTPTESSGRSYLVSSALALLALMLAFTFGAAESRFSLRQQLVAHEANAIGTAYLRIQLLDEPSRGDLSRQILRYAALRSRWAEVSGDPERLAAFDRESAALQSEIWRLVGLAVRANRIITLNGPLVDPINESFDLAEAREAAQEARVPVTILRVLAVYAVAAAGIMGFGSATERRYGVISTSVLVLLTLAFCLVLDIDRPNSGTVIVNQGPMLRTLATMRDSEAAKLVAPPSGPVQRP